MKKNVRTSCYGVKRPHLMPLKSSLPIVLLFALSLLFTTHLSAFPGRIGVMPFENVTKDSSLDWLSMGIPETITSDLLVIKGIVLVDRLQLRKVLREQGLQLTGAIDEATAVKVGKLIGADILVVGAFQKQAQTMRLTARFVNVQTGGILQTAKATGKLNDIFDLQDQIVKDLVKNLNIELKQNELIQLAEKPTESLEAYEHFGKGSLLEARKDYPGALKELQKATTADSKFALPKTKYTDIFLSLNKGNYWTYEGTSSMSEGGVPENHVVATSRAGGNELFNGIPVFSYITGGEAQSSSVGNIQLKVTTYYVKKDDGIYTVGSKIESSIVKPKPSVQTIIFEPPYLVFPYDIEVGQKWEVNSAFKDMEGTTGKQEEKREVTKRETIAVPAGTFDCFVIESRQESKVKVPGFSGSGTSIITMWYAPGVGTIKTRMKSEMAKTTAVSESVLKEYHIEE